jgi:biopolymer transport protein ExbD
MARRELQEINAGSMADIAFLLLVFFLMVTTIQTEKGIFRQLPPPIPPDFEIPEVRERDVFVVLVNSKNQLLVEGRPMKLARLKDAAKDFLIANGVFTDKSENPNFPIRSWVGEADITAKIKTLEDLRASTEDEESLKSIDESIDKNNRKLHAIEVFGKSYKELPGSAMISMQNDNATDYDTYIQVQNELQSATNELRDELSLEYFGVSYVALEDEAEKKRNDAKAHAPLKAKMYTVQAVFPQRISEAEPKN